MAVTNTGIVLRTITGVHDANFVHPIGDELISNGGFDTDTNWIKGVGITIDGGKANFINSMADLRQDPVVENGKYYKVTYTISNYVSGSIRFEIPSNVGSGIERSANGTYTEILLSMGTAIQLDARTAFTGSIDNISVKEMLVNRESTATNTGIVERAITGSNESELWLDAESTSVVNNTGIVERPITGVNESDPMFPDNTISNIVNIAGLISSLLADLEARATTFENREATQNILINLQKC